MPIRNDNDVLRTLSDLIKHVKQNFFKLPPKAYSVASSFTKFNLSETKLPTILSVPRRTSVQAGVTLSYDSLATDHTTLHAVIRLANLSQRALRLARRSRHNLDM